MSKQLVSIIKDFEMWDFYSPIDNKLKFIDASEIPFIRYPNRVPCYEANLYMQSKLHAGLSRRVKGGTLRTYAHNISHLVRYCYENKINIADLNDARFSLFIRGLQAEKKLTGKRFRSINQVIKIGRQCIDFIKHVKEIHGLKHYIGTERTNAIRVIEKRSKRYIEGRKKPIETMYYVHSSFPKPNAEKKRSPISDDAAAKLKQVILAQPNKSIRQRDICIYQTLEQTGARRTEVTMLQVSDVKNALSSDNECPLLRLTTLKRKDNKVERFLPVPRIFLENLKEYITTTRRRIIKSTIGKSNDHNYVFIAQTTGEALKPDTITTYMNKWSKTAGIKEDAFAHLFRHAFITEKLKCIILEHNVDNQDEFRKSLLNTERFKMQLQQWTGHTHLHSLDAYIDLAFADLAGVKQTYNAVTLKSSVELMEDKIAEIESELHKNDKTITEITLELKKTLAAFKSDIKRSLS